MATITVPLVTSTQKGDTAGTANTICIRDVNGALTNSGEIINGNLTTLTENVQVNTVTTSKTLDNTGGIWNCSGASTITLPAIASVSNGRWYRITKTDASNTLTVNTSDSSTINGASSTTLTTQWQSKLFYADGTNWMAV